jgi:6,7-dimethyl-8-ribityllumazine synthase
MPTFEGDYSKPAGRFAIVAAKFNRDVVDRLVAGAFDGFRKHGVADASIDLIHVPGAFEIPLACRHLAEGGRYVAVVALGAVIQGDTDHYAHICEQTAAGVMRVTLDTNVPVIFGILTCQTEELALARAGGEHGNKGFDAALTAIQMVNLLKKMS